MAITRTKPPARVETLVSTTVTRKHTIKLTGEMILDMLRRTNAIPENASVQFQVPGGGDYSNTRVDVTDDQLVYVEWEQNEYKDERL